MALGQYVHNVLVMLEILVLGLVVSESEAGIFSFAFVLAVQANAIIGFQVGGVLQPIFGRLAGEPDRQQASYLRAMRTLGMGIVAISCMQAALAPSLFRLAFDARWEPSIAVFMVLSVGQAFYFGTAPTMALLKAQRRFGANLAWQGTQLAVAGALFFVAARHGGVLAVAWASAGTWALGVVAASCAAVRAGARRGLLAVFAGPWLVSLPVAAASWAAASWLDGLGLAGSAVAVLILGPLGLGAIVLSTRWTAPAVWCDARAASRSVLRRIPARMVPERWRTGA